MIAIIFLATALILLSLYLYFYKGASIQIVLIKGFILGASTYNEPFDNTDVKYLDIYIGFIIISLIWNE